MTRKRLLRSALLLGALIIAAGSLYAIAIIDEAARDAAFCCAGI